MAIEYYIVIMMGLAWFVNLILLNAIKIEPTVNEESMVSIFQSLESTDSLSEEIEKIYDFYSVTSWKNGFGFLCWFKNYQSS
jgi:hypothetical protein